MDLFSESKQPIQTNDSLDTLPTFHKLPFLSPRVSSNFNPNLLFGSPLDANSPLKSSVHFMSPRAQPLLGDPSTPEHRAPFHPSLSDSKRF